MSDLKYLTLNLLGKNGLDACTPALIAFEEKFGQRALITDVIEWLNDPGLEYGSGWYSWILGQDINITKAFLANGADINIDDANALLWAGDSGKLGIFKFLINSGIDIELCDKEHEILVDMCLTDNREKFVKNLLDSGKYKLLQIKFIIRRYREYIKDGPRKIMDDFIIKKSKQ